MFTPMLVYFNEMDGAFILIPQDEQKEPQVKQGLKIQYSEALDLVTTFKARGAKGYNRNDDRRLHQPVNDNIQIGRDTIKCENLGAVNNDEHLEQYLSSGGDLAYITSDTGSWTKYVIADEFLPLEFKSWIQELTQPKLRLGERFAH